MKTKKQLRKNVVRTIKSILATVLLLTCIEYFPTIASAEGEEANVWYMSSKSMGFSYMTKPKTFGFSVRCVK